MLLCTCSVNKVESNLILSKIIFLCVKIKLKPHMGDCGGCLQSWGSQAISQMKQKHVNECRSGLQHEGRTGDQEVPTSYRAPRPASADALSWPFEQVSGWSRRPTSPLGAITFHITRTLTEWKFPQRAPNPGVHTCQIVSRQPFESHYQSVARSSPGQREDRRFSSMTDVVAESTKQIRGWQRGGSERRGELIFPFDWRRETAGRRRVRMQKAFCSPI